MNVSFLFNQIIPDIDPTSFRIISFVSHAHSDHVAFNSYGKKRLMICTSETAELVKYRLKENSLETFSAMYGENYCLYDVIKNTFFENKDEYKNIYFAFYPSGHILGSSQIFIESGKSTLLYSGDFKIKSSSVCEPFRFPVLDKKLDYLIMESTFGKSKYIFPDKKILENKIINFCKNTLANSELPVLLSYSLGKSQELLGILKDKGFQIILHGAVFNISEIYKKLGVDLGDYKKYSPSLINLQAIEDNSVLIIPPQYNKSKMMNNIGNKRVAVVTGWAVDNSAKYIHQADEGIALSDHADYEELLEYAKTLSPEKIYVNHGFAMELSRDLNKLGLNAEPYQENRVGLF